jgi:hypothetical protein
MRDSLRQQVHVRASDSCEYCRIPKQFDVLPFQIDHVIAEKHGGETVLSNLALACYNCNAHKGPNIAGRDPETGGLTPLFQPREQIWLEHFQWNGAELLGLTAVGRTSVQVLNINDRDRVELRKILIAAGLFHI